MERWEWLSIKSYSDEPRLEAWTLRVISGSLDTAPQLFASSEQECSFSPPALHKIGLSFAEDGRKLRRIRLRSHFNQFNCLNYVDQFP